MGWSVLMPVSTPKSFARVRSITRLPLLEDGSAVPTLIGWPPAARQLVVELICSHVDDRPIGERYLRDSGIDENRREAREVHVRERRVGTATTERPRIWLHDPTGLQATAASWAKYNICWSTMSVLKQSIPVTDQAPLCIPGAPTRVAATHTFRPQAQRGTLHQLPVARRCCHDVLVARPLSDTGPFCSPCNC